MPLNDVGVEHKQQQRAHGLMERVRLSAFHCKRAVSGHEGEGCGYVPVVGGDGRRLSRWLRWVRWTMVLFDIFDLWRSVECFIQAFIPRQSGFCCCFFTDVKRRAKRWNSPSDIHYHKGINTFSTGV
jgi:hypothetical protein